MKNYCILLFVLLSATALRAQQHVLQGSFKDLTAVAEYNVVFDYTGQKIADFATEEEFLSDKMNKREGESAEAFKTKWYADREANYEPKFIAYFNERMKETPVRVAKNPAAMYTILIKTTWIYPGYNVWVTKQVAKISAVITVYETANPANILLKVEYDKSVGLEPNYKEKAFDFGDRIAGAYEKLARNFTLQLKRFVK